MITLMRTVSRMAVVVMLVFCAGCSGTLLKNYGQITPSADATRTFESYQMNPDFNYYVSGSDLYPNALMGLRKSYELDSDLWKKITPSPQEFREIIQHMQTKALSLSQYQHGFAILDDKGAHIGIWYSILSARTAVQMKEDGKVIIYTPAQNTYERYERDGFPDMRR